jgi:hypothetical protein
MKIPFMRIFQVLSGKFNAADVNTVVNYAYKITTKLSRYEFSPFSSLTILTEAHEGKQT